MKKIKNHPIFLIVVLLLLGVSCKNNDLTKENKVADSNVKYRNLSKQFKNYWYSGEAEITSYTLQQARYGEIREGHAVLIFVTEDFLPSEQVKANTQSPENISVLKLNATKNFNTGIYPYSIMQSTFYPLSTEEHAIKISSSIQEWCGQTYMQLNNRAKFEINSHSYFQGEADQNSQLEKTFLENELWTQLRINPKQLPTGDLQIIPSFEFISLKHVELKPYQANAVLSTASYTIEYPELDRALIINFNKEFPFEIVSWSESFNSGPEKLTTKATKLEAMKSPYWSKNSNKDAVLRDSLKLK